MKRGLWCLGRPVWLPVSGYLLAVQPSVAVWTLQKSKMISRSFSFWFCSAGLLGSKSDMPESLTSGPSLTRGRVTAPFFLGSISYVVSWVPASRPPGRELRLHLSSLSRETESVWLARFKEWPVPTQQLELAAALPPSSDFVSQNFANFFNIGNFSISLRRD